MNQKLILLLSLSIFLAYFFPLIDLYLILWVISSIDENYDKSTSMVFLIFSFLKSFFGIGVIGVFPLAFVLSMSIGNLLAKIIPSLNRNKILSKLIKITLVIVIETFIQNLLTGNQLYFDSRLTIKIILTTLTAFTAYLYTNKRRRLI